jgi:RNA polymerase sigma factor (TIGR02999 family)
MIAIFRIHASTLVHVNGSRELQWFSEVLKPMPADANDITELIRAWGNGDDTALDRLTPLVYGELRRIAGRHMRNQRAGHTLQTTALVHEAYLHLLHAKTAGWKDRSHFFAASAQIMRRILIDAARARSSRRRGGGVEVGNDSTTINLDEIPVPIAERADELLALESAIIRLEKLDARKAKVIELRFFGGLSVEETAEVLNLSPQTVIRDWRLARVWLAREMRP